MAAVKNVFEAWAAVMADVQSIAKSDRNQQQGFAFRGIDAVMQSVGPALRVHGVFVIPSGQDMRSESYETKNKTSMRNVTVTMQFRVYGPGGDYFDGTSFGEAADSGDKAVTKAQSVAYRTFLLQSLTVPTGDVDPDAYSHERAVSEAPPDTALVEANEARGELLTALKDSGWTGDKLIARYRDDYAADLLAADTSAVKAFQKALEAEAKAQDAGNTPTEAA